MIQINQYNYEEFVLDYLDGTLNAELKVAMDEFFAQNPELAIEVAELNAIVLEKPNLKLPTHKKQQLKRVCSGTTFITLENYEQVLFNATEQNLSVEQQVEFEKELQLSPWLNTEYLIWQKTKVQPLAQQFENKAALLQKAPIFSLNIFRISVAASTIGVLLASALWFYSTSNVTAPQVASYPNFKANSGQVQSFQANAIAQLASLATTPKSSISPMAVKNIEPINTANSPVLAKRKPADFNEYAALFRVDPNESETVSAQETTQGTREEYYPTVREFLVSSIKKNNIPQEQLVEPEKLVKGDFLAIAANTMNKIFKTKIQVEREYNDDNAPVYLAIQTEKFKFDRKINPKAVTKR